MDNSDRTRSLWSDGMWFKSTYSDDGVGCVEVVFADGGAAVRDSKDRNGPRLLFSRQEWTAFVAGVRAGEFDHPA